VKFSVSPGMLNRQEYCRKSSSHVLVDTPTNAYREKHVNADGAPSKSEQPEGSEAREGSPTGAAGTGRRETSRPVFTSKNMRDPSVREGQQLKSAERI
jgi:hypothetical protein